MSAGSMGSGVEYCHILATAIHSSRVITHAKLFSLFIGILSSIPFTWTSIEPASDFLLRLYTERLLFIGPFLTVRSRIDCVTGTRRIDVPGSFDTLPRGRSKSTEW